MKDGLLIFFYFIIVPFVGTAAIEKCVDDHYNSLPPTPAKQDASFHIVSD